MVWNRVNVVDVWRGTRSRLNVYVRGVAPCTEASVWRFYGIKSGVVRCEIYHGFLRVSIGPAGRVRRFFIFFSFSSHISTFQLLGKPWSQVSSLPPPRFLLSNFLSRIGFSNPTARPFFIECR